MTDGSRMQRLQDLFHRLVALPADERTAFLDRLDGDDLALREELATLVSHDADDGGDEDTLLACLHPDSDRPPGESHSGSTSRIGGYRLIREIGSGGMGSVFLAERDDREFRHQVAIKLVRGFPSAPILERFRRERELLASLRHPNIARLFDGGTTPTGQPYLVMEYIEGVPLDVWCRQRQAPLHQRLRLFQALCSAVQHAHQNLIVHRDLKPANVLVRGDDQPVLLDFGIGKLLDDSDQPGEATQLRAMTPAYASPEQLRGEAVTTLSDIYGLGLILFELLTGTPARKQTGDTTSQSASRVAAQGDPRLRAEARLLRGDLDNIVRKALREEPGRRYPDAGALAADIDAWFQGRPVAAAPDAWHYRLRKFARRHPVALGSTAAIILVLAVLSARLAAEREQARLEAENANQSAEFLVELFRSASPEATRGRELTVRTLLDEASSKLDERRFSRPEVRARLESALGDIYFSLGLMEPSLDLLHAAVARLRARDSRDDADGRTLALALKRLTRAYVQVGRFAEAVAAGTESLSLNRRLLPPGHPQIGHSLLSLGVALQENGDSDTAWAMFQEGGELFAGAGPEYRENYASALHNLGWAAFRAGNHDDARDVLERALAIKLEVIGELHPSTFRTVSMLAQTETALGELATGAERLQGLLAGQIRLLGEPSQPVAATYGTLALTLQDLGRYGEAEQHYRTAIEHYAALGEGAGPGHAIPVNNYANLLELLEDFDASEAMYRRALTLRQALGAQPIAIARGHHNLARVLMHTGNLRQALAQAERAWAVRGELTPAHHPERLDAMVLLARLALRQGEPATAQAWLARHAEASADSDLAPRQRGRALEAAAELAAALGAREEEIARRHRVIDAYATGGVDGYPELARQRLRLAAVLAGGDDDERAEARTLLDQVRATVETDLAPEAPSRRLLANVTVALDRPANPRNP